MGGEDSAVKSDLNINRLNMFGTHTSNDMRLDAAELAVSYGLNDKTSGASLNLADLNLDPLPSNINYVDIRFNNLEAAVAGNFLQFKGWKIFYVKSICAKIVNM